MSSMIELATGPEGTLNAYFAAAATKGAPGLVVVQEIFGVNASMRQAADDWCAAGFNVLVPDVFWRQAPGVELEPRKPEEFTRGVELMQALDQERAVQDLDLARAWLAQYGGHERVSALGYCLGGRLVVKMAAALPVYKAVSYYGVGLQNLIPDMATQGPAVLLHIAELDAYVPPAVRQTLQDEADRRAGWQAWVYPGCDHAFARPGGEHFDADAAALAKARSLAFLNA